MGSNGAMRPLLSGQNCSYASVDGIELPAMDPEEMSQSSLSRYRKAGLILVSMLALVGVSALLISGSEAYSSSVPQTAESQASASQPIGIQSAGTDERIVDTYVDFDEDQKDFQAVHWSTDVPDDRSFKGKKVEKASEELQRIIKSISKEDGTFDRAQLGQAVKKDAENCWFDEAVSKSDPNTKASDGYTLFTQTQGTSGPQWTYLIDMAGQIIHTWYHPDNPVTKIVKLLANGNLMRMTWAYQKYFSDTFDAASYIEEVSWDGTIERKCHVANDNLTAHHDVWKTEAGTYLVPSWKIVSVAHCRDALGLSPDALIWTGIVENRKNLGGGCMIDGVVEYRAKAGGGVEDCEKVWEWWMDDHIVQDMDAEKPNYGNVSSHPELIDINFWAGEEAWKDTSLPQTLHVNTVAYNEDLKQIMLSSFQKGEIYIIEHSKDSATAKAHKGGKYGMGGDLLFRAGNPRAYKRDQTLVSNDINLEGFWEHQIYRLFYKCHTAHWIEEGLPGAGNVLVFSNGFGQPKHSHPGKPFSAAVEFSIPVVGGKEPEAPSTEDTAPEEEETAPEEEETAPEEEETAPEEEEKAPEEEEKAPEEEEWLRKRQLLQQDIKVINPGSKYTTAKYPEGIPSTAALEGDVGTYGMAAVQAGHRPFQGIGLQWQWNDFFQEQVTHFGGVQRLPNGNTFATISTSDSGGFRFVEVTPEGELAWMFRPDYESMPDLLEQGYVGRSVYRAYRYNASHPALKGRDLSPICKPPLKDRLQQENRFDMKRYWGTSSTQATFPEP
ncbi:hypothetical protein CYMTET_10515 [Cymbomonas tetramitiformis]|uniref:Uncharacterized protein n=1 Tax=Cymbomonas tetramitiformis TaxID=36881 RepID=A0AAE0GPG6_9CHLO|nr:hypothetical protein CYMTET_10515 [Cymbomonas tetramitiformis]